MLKLILYCSQMSEFEKQKSILCNLGYEPGHLVFGNSKIKTREQIINENLNAWLLFLDHDCVPTAETKAVVDRIMASTENDPIAFAGVYSNPTHAGSLQRAHNFIANGWLESNLYYSAEPALLGGVFLIHTKTQVAPPEKKFWGAEDKYLALSLKNAGYKIQISKHIVVVHNTNKSLKHFVRRAILHGRHDAIYFDTSNNFKFSYWIRKIDFLDLRLVSLILLHFCIQKVAKIIQTILPKSKQ